MMLSIKQASIQSQTTGFFLFLFWALLKCLFIYLTMVTEWVLFGCVLQALITDFEVSEGIYSRARIEDADSVCLWLGANVMLEYSCEEVNCCEIVNVV